MKMHAVKITKVLDVNSVSIKLVSLKLTLTPTVPLILKIDIYETCKRSTTEGNRLI